MPISSEAAALPELPRTTQAIKGASCSSASCAGRRGSPRQHVRPSVGPSLAAASGREPERALLDAASTAVCVDMARHLEPILCPPGVGDTSMGKEAAGSAAMGSAGDGNPDSGKTHHFNEQTNYVPKSTIITVGGPARRPTHARRLTVRSSSPARALTCSPSWIRRRSPPACTLSAARWARWTRCRGLPADTLCESRARHLGERRVLTAPASTSTVGQLLYGRLSDIWSRKVVLLAGLAIFFVGSLASSLAQSVLQLTVFRAFTGIGGGGLMTVAQLIVSDVVPLRERGKYQGILVSLVARRWPRRRTPDAC